MLLCFETLKTETCELERMLQFFSQRAGLRFYFADEADIVAQLAALFTQSSFTC